MGWKLKTHALRHRLLETRVGAIFSVNSEKKGLRRRARPRPGHKNNEATGFALPRTNFFVRVLYLCVVYLMDGGAVVLPYGRELVYAAQASVGEDERSGFQHPLPAILRGRSRRSSLSPTPPPPPREAADIISRTKGSGENERRAVIRGAGGEEATRTVAGGTGLFSPMLEECGDGGSGGGGGGGVDDGGGGVDGVGVCVGVDGCGEIVDVVRSGAVLCLRQRLFR